MCEKAEFKQKFAPYLPLLSDHDDPAIKLIALCIKYPLLSIRLQLSPTNVQARKRTIFNQYTMAPHIGQIHA